MVLVSISSISKFLPGLLVVTTCGALLFSSCSSKPKKSADEVSLALSEELASLSKKVQVINYGPSQTAGTDFLEKTNDYGLGNLTAVSFNAIDLNFDGYTDLVVLPTYYSRPKFFEFVPGQKKFVPLSYDPLPGDFKASLILIYDINKDKVPDLISAVLNQRSEVSQLPPKLYLGSMRNGVLVFSEADKAFNLPPEPISGMSLLDYDLDGWIDLFISNWYENKNNEYLPVADHLLRNNRGKFEEVTSLLKDEAKKAPNQLYPPNARPTYGASTCDLDQNGYPDIMTVSSSGYKNKLWMNLKESTTGARYFQDYGPTTNYGSDPDGSLIPTGGGRSFFSACTDYNDDGIMDIFLGELSHAYDNESVDRSSILSGSRETFPPFFLRTEYLSDAENEAWNQGDRRGVWMDYNLDGRIDLLVDNSGFPPYSRLVMFEQDETHAFMNVAPQLGIDIVNPTGSISIDLNQDGLLDIITSQNNVRKADIPPRLYVFENHAPRAGKKSVRVHLRGLKSNTEAIGAMVLFYTRNIKSKKKVVQRRWVEYTQGGLASQNESGITFGLNADWEAVGLKVKWPFVNRTGRSSGVTIEKLYTLKDLPMKDHLDVTLCEDGKVLVGKVSCFL
jgi:hypothetical protein